MFDHVRCGAALGVVVEVAHANIAASFGRIFIESAKVLPDVALHLLLLAHDDRRR